METSTESKRKSRGAVLIAGPKFCGKTTTSLNFQRAFIEQTPKVLFRQRMSLFESGDSKGIVSLLRLFEQKALDVEAPNSNHPLEEMAFLICRGGWPLSVQPDAQIALEVTKNDFDGLFTFEDRDSRSFRNKKTEIFPMI